MISNNGESNTEKRGWPVVPHEWLFERWCPHYSPSRRAFHPTSLAQISPRPGVVYGVCLFSLTGDLGIWGEKLAQWQKWRLSLFLLRYLASRPSLLETSAAKPWTLPPKVDNSLQVSWNSVSNAQACINGSFSQAERTKRSNHCCKHSIILCLYIYIQYLNEYNIYTQSYIYMYIASSKATKIQPISVLNLCCFARGHNLTEMFKKYLCLEFLRFLHHLHHNSAHATETVVDINSDSSWEVHKAQNTSIFRHPLQTLPKNVEDEGLNSL